jgi:hypothetical protein
VPGGELVEHVRDNRGGLEGLRCVVHHDRQVPLPGGDQLVARQETPRGHQRKRLVAAAENGGVVARRGCVVARRFRDARQHGRFVGIIGRERRERPAEIVLRRTGKAVLSVAHVDEAGVAGEDLFLREAFRSERLAHASFEPQREPDLFELPEHHVGVARANHSGQRASHETGVPELVAVLLRRLALQKHTPHELLRERGSALREDRAAAGVVAAASRGQPRPPRADPHFADHARKAEIVHAVMGEEPLVLRGENRLTHDRRDVGVGGDVAVLPGELDQRLAVGVVDVTDAGKFKARETPQVGKVLAIEADVVQRARRGYCGANRRDADERHARQQHDDAAGP